MKDQVEHLVKVRNELGESPLWDPRTQILYWVDINRQIFYQWDYRTRQVLSSAPPASIYALGLREKGGLVAGTYDGLIFYDPQTRQMDLIDNVILSEPERRFNDGEVDPRGRFWAGTLDVERTPTNRLYCLDTDLTLHVRVDDLQQSNGLGWSPDAKTLYLTDTRAAKIFAFDYEAESGKISNRRVLVEVPQDEGEGVADGLTVDSEGFLWSARFRGGKLVRYDPQGKVEREVRLPVAIPSSCVFGGENMDELYVTTCTVGLSDQELEEQPEAGGILRVWPGVRGQDPVRFKG
jgi:sugar lactone lactonase YvrE